VNYRRQQIFSNSNQNFSYFSTDWIKDYGEMPNWKTVLQHYKEYMEHHEQLECDRIMLFRFCHEILGCVNLTWKEKALKNGRFSQVVTTSDEAFAYFMICFYNKITTKEDRKQKKMVGEELDNAMHFFGDMMKEIQQLKMLHSSRIEHLDEDIADYIRQKYARKKPKRRRDEDESTIESAPKVNIELQNLFDLNKLRGINKTAV
jgi:hypothetical protein